MNENRFARTPQAQSVEAIAQRYGVLPSHILGFEAGSAEAMLIDMFIVAKAIERENEASGTVGGDIKAKRVGWDSDIVREIEEQKRHEHNT